MNKSSSSGQALATIQVLREPPPSHVAPRSRSPVSLPPAPDGNGTLRPSLFIRQGLIAHRPPSTLAPSSLPCPLDKARLLGSPLLAVNKNPGKCKDLDSGPGSCRNCAVPGNRRFDVFACAGEHVTHLRFFAPTPAQYTRAKNLGERRASSKGG
jgi:hypothetical protein